MTSKTSKTKDSTKDAKKDPSPSKKEEKKDEKKTDSKAKKPDTSTISKKSNNNETTINQKEEPKEKLTESNLAEPLNNKQKLKNENNNGLTEKCEGCFDNEGVIFCVVCEKIYCRTCENAIHLVPINMSHERIAITEIHHLKKLCYHHHQPLKFYCESCEEPICFECHQIGPHNNKLHRITNVIDSFRKKFNYINTIIEKNLIDKYENLISNLQIIESQTDQVKTAKNEIERGIRTEYTRLIEDLRSEEGKKLALLQSESSLLQKDINRINDLIATVREINNSDTPDMVEFLLRFRKINETIEICLAKEVKKVLDVKVDDFPREIENRQKKLQMFDKMKKLINLKDEIIWAIIQEKKKSQNSELLKLQEKHYNEIVEWNKIVDKHMLELKNYQLICNFCGIHLDGNTVNGNCSKNLPEIENKERFTNIRINSDIVNSGRHWFGEPIKDFPEKFTNFKNLSLQTNILISKQKSQPLNDDLNKSFDDSQALIQKMRDNAKQTKIPKLEDLITNVLFRDTELVSFDTVNSFLKFKLDLDENDIFKFIELIKQNFPKHNQFSLLQILSCLKNKSIFKEPNNPFENNFYSDFSQKKKIDEVDPNKASEWIFKVAKLIENNSISLQKNLIDLDFDNDGYIYPDDLRILFMKLKLNLNTNDIENMISYFGYENDDKISIENFSKNFLGHLNEAK